MPIQNTGENDLHEPKRNDYGYNKGTIRLVSEYPVPLDSGLAA